MKKYIITFIFFITTEYCWGGETEQALLDKAYEIRNLDRDEYNRLLEVLEKKSLSKTQEDYLTYLKARRALISGNDAKAIELAKNSSQSSDIRVAIISDQLLSNIYNLNSNLEQAFNYIFRALAMAQNYPNKDVAATVYAGAANLYAELEDYKTAAEFADKTLNTSNTPTQRCFIYATVGLTGNRHIDKNTLESAIVACTEAKQSLFIYLLYLNHTEYLLESNDALAAYNFIKKHFEDIRSQGFDSYTHSARMLIGRSARRIGKLDEAKAELLICLQEDDDDDSTQHALRELALISLENKDFEQAANYFKNLDIVSSKITNKQLNNQLAYQAAKFKSLDRQHKIVNLTRINELNELKVTLDEHKIKLLIISIVLIVLLGIVFTIAIFKQSVRFRRDAYKDGLTNIANRRWFDQYLRKLLKSNQECITHCLVIFDLDKFKNINDHYGHSAGDMVIKKVSAAVTSQIRTNDPFARIGGEEFAVILENCTLSEAKIRAEKYRKAIASITFEDDLSEITISASFGMCSTSQAKNDFETLFKQADEAMYQSKKNGRNQVTVFSQK